MTKKPDTSNSLAAQELDKAQKQFDAFDGQIKEMTMDRMSAAPKEETEPQVKLSQKDIEKSKDQYLKPVRVISAKDKFNEKFRESYNFDKEYVQFIAEHKEIIGETIEMWTRPYGGMPAEYWNVPTGKPIWGPRYLAEQIKRKSYHRLTMTNSIVQDHGFIGQQFRCLAVDSQLQRLDARPVSTRKSVFMGASGF